MSGSEPVQDFATLLRRHRVLSGLSQEALAERARLSVRGISDLERGVRRSPHPATIARLADALDLTVAEREALLIAAASTAIASPTPGLAQTVPPTPVVAPPAEERRWVTVLAVQLGGFGELSERLDPEDLRELSDRCAGRIAEEIRRLDGTLLHSEGGSLLAAFGAPSAHEDDAERAVRAGLAIRDCPLPLPQASLAGDTRVDVRVGVATGEVMAGLQGPDAQRHYAVSGAPVNAAVGLAGGGDASAVLVGEQTYRATYQHVRYRPAPAVAARDWTRPLAAWEALAVSPAPLARVLGDAPFVGREHEIGVLEAALARVRREQRPHLVSVLGEPGIGKSRLAAEFERRTAGSGTVAMLHGRCLPYGEVVAYRALTMALFELAGVVPTDTPDVARGRLRQVVVDALAAPPSDPAVRDLERHLAMASGLDTQTDRGRNPPDERSMHVSVRHFLEALARTRPVCLIIDDLHWGDEALLRLLEHVANHARAAPLLIVTHARLDLLERRPTWGGGIQAFTSLVLEPLDRVAGLTLADSLCRERGLPVAQVETISRVAGGNPLFAEELCAALAEGGKAGGVPSALRALISARLDALPADDRRVLLHAAVLGKHVWPSALAALDGASGSDLGDRLDALERRDLLRSQLGSRFGGRAYAFKHDLIQEVAYGLMPRAERRRLHARIVDWLEATAGERVDEAVDLLAHHAVSAELHERALDYLARAADGARRATAHREEAALLEQAIGTAERCGRGDLVPELRARRGRALIRVALWAPARRELEAALAGLPADRSELRAEVLVDLATASNWSMDIAGMRRWADEALDLAHTIGRTDLTIDAQFWLAWATGSEGDVAGAIDQYAAAVARTHAVGVVQAPSVLPLYATALCWAGQFQPAVERGHEAVRTAREAGDSDSAILALQVLGLALAGTGAYDEASQTFDEAARYGRDHGIGPFLARALAMSAGYHLDVFDFEGHAAVATEACELARSANFTPALTSASIDLLVNLSRRGEVGQAEQIVQGAASAVEQASAWHGWLWHLRFTEARGELALARGEIEAAIELSDTALRMARGRRPKYEVLSLVTRAAALRAAGRERSAVSDLRTAVRIARSLGDPALFLRSASELLAVEGDAALRGETQRTAAAIARRLPTQVMRERFERAEPVQRLYR